MCRCHIYMKKNIEKAFLGMNIEKPFSSSISAFDNIYIFFFLKFKLT